MDPKKAGKISKEADGYRVGFERHFNYAAMTVWEAITNPAKIKVWFMEMEIELKPGGRMTIYHGDEQNSRSYGTVTTVEPGRVFEYIWENEDAPHEITRWEIIPEGPQSCKLVLTHSRIIETYAWRVPSGWHISLDYLQDVLDGRTSPFPPDHKRPDELIIKNYYETLVKATFKIA